jgi:hypothetical protein
VDFGWDTPLLSAIAGGLAKCKGVSLGGSAISLRKGGGLAPVRRHGLVYPFWRRGPLSFPFTPAQPGGFVGGVRPRGVKSDYPWAAAQVNDLEKTAANFMFRKRCNPWRHRARGCTTAQPVNGCWHKGREEASLKTWLRQEPFPVLIVARCLLPYTSWLSTTTTA